MNKIKQLKKQLNGNSFLLFITVALFVAMYVAGMIVFADKGFAKPQMFLNLFITDAGLLVTSMGLTIVMISGGIDISVGSVTALVCMVTAVSMEKYGLNAYTTIVIALLIWIAIMIIMKFTKFGRSIYAVGGNQQSALMMGLNVKKIKFQAYILDGILASIGGYLVCLNSCAGFVEQAKGMEMDAISASVIGGTLLSGGVGTPFGTLFGVLIKGTISSLITTQGTLSSWWVRIVLSALLCFFIILQSVFAKFKTRNK